MLYHKRIVNSCYGLDIKHVLLLGVRAFFSVRCRNEISLLPVVDDHISMFFRRQELQVLSAYVGALHAIRLRYDVIVTHLFSMAR